MRRYVLVITLLLLALLLSGCKPPIPDDRPQHPLEVFAGSSDPRIWHLMKRDFHQVFDGLSVRIRETTIETNAAGFRDDPFNVEKPDATRRIIVLGDSMAFGLGVEGYDTFPQVLEDRLSEDGAYDVMNLAIPGMGTRGQVALLETRGMQYDPDMILLQFMENDWDNWTRLEELFSQLAREVNHVPGTPYPPGLQEEVYRRIGEEQAAMSFEERWEVVEGSLAELDTLVGDLPVIILAFSSDERQHAALEEIARSFGWVYLDAGDAYAGRPHSEMILHERDPHPSVEAHSLLADALLPLVKGAFS